MSQANITIEVKSQSNTYSLLGWVLLFTYIILTFFIPSIINFFLGFLIGPVKLIIPLIGLFGFLYGLVTKKGLLAILGWGLLTILLIITTLMTFLFNDAALLFYGLLGS